MPKTNRGKYNKSNNNMRQVFAECVVAYAIYVEPNLTTEHLCDIFINILSVENNLKESEVISNYGKNSKERTYLSVLQQHTANSKGSK